MDEPSTNIKQHSFALKTFVKPTSCDICKKLLWGIARQGFSCSQCKVITHRRCMKKANNSVKCEISLTRRRHSSVDLTATFQSSISDDELNRYESTLTNVSSIETLRSLKSDSKKLSADFFTSSSPMLNDETSTMVLSAPPSPPASGFTTPVNEKLVIDDEKISEDAEHSQNNSSIERKAASVIRDLIETTARKAADLQKLPRGPPKLNVLTTLPKNFTKFVMKVGPLSEFQNKIESIIRWDNPTETLLVLCVYVLLCLNPHLIVLFPNFLLIAIIGYNYYIHTKDNLSSKSKKKIKRTSTVDPSNIYPDTINYRKNMQFIQNTMGMYCDIYENLMVVHSHLNWSNEDETKQILQVAVVALIGLVFVFSYIPWSFVFLIGGIFAFVGNTPVGFAISDILSRYLYTFSRKVSGSTIFLKFRSSISNKGITEDDPSASSLRRGKLIFVECFENQRWWAGLGWIAHMLRNERTGWTDYDGKIQLKPKEESSIQEYIRNGLSRVSTNPKSSVIEKEVADEVNWEWEEGEDWVIDKTWSEKLDEDGWLFTDHRWNTIKKPGATYLTRKRRWIRAARSVESINHSL